MNPFAILVIDDETPQLKSLESFLKRRKFQVFTAASGEEAYQIAGKQTIDLVLTDFRMPGWTGLVVLRKMKELNPDLEVVVMTAYGRIEDAVEIMKAGAYDYLTKPIDLDELENLIKRVQDKRFLVTENQQLRQQLQERFKFDAIISQSGEMESVLNTAGRVAPSKASVLVRGESGTGKELIAKAIHYSSPRQKKPFVVVNVAALSENLIESELFGHEKGAFTGATQMKRGRFELAQGGTLLLDEIGEMSFSLQSKLLRVLQGHQFERVGGMRTITVDVRVIASTNQDLQTAIQEKRFREDLFYRLNVFPIQIPPLRERQEDILPLAEFFIGKISRRMGRPLKKPNEEVQRILYSYSWPGNIRELENAIERALIVSQFEQIEPQDLPLRPLPESAITGPSPTLAEIEKLAILRALEKNEGDRQMTARELGISLRKLQYRLKEYGLTGKRE